MEVRPGYKQTEAGVIPEDWEVRRLSEHFRIYAGGDVPEHSLSQTESASHPYPIFANALQGRGLYGYTNEQRSKKDSLTITARGYLGHAEYRNEPYFPIVRLLVLEPTGQLDARFTTYAVNDRVAFAVESTGVPQLTAPQVGKYSVAAPPTLPEQRAIATALSNVDALLGGLSRLIAKKRALKQAVMQQLLTGQTRLPGFDGEWKFARLGEGISLFSGQHVLAEHCNTEGEGIPYITGPADFPQGHIQHTKFTKRPGTICLPSDILVTVKGSGSGAIVLADAAYCISRQLMAIRVDGWDCRFIYYSLLQNAAKFKASSTGLIPGLSRPDILDQPLPVPPTVPEQTAIAAVLSDIDAELSALEARRDKTRDLKHGMMQELLTGKTRLVPARGGHA